MVKEVEVKNREITIQFGSVCEPNPGNGHSWGAKRHIVLGLIGETHIAVHSIDEHEDGEISIGPIGGSGVPGDLGQVIEFWEYPVVLEAYKNGWKVYMKGYSQEIKEDLSIDLPADIEEVLHTNSQENPRTYILT